MAKSNSKPLENAKKALADAETTFGFVKSVLGASGVKQMADSPVYGAAMRSWQRCLSAVQKLEKADEASKTQKPAKAKKKPTLPVGNVFAATIPSDIFDAKSAFVKILMVADGNRWDGENIGFRMVHINLAAVPEDMVNHVGTAQLFELEVVEGQKEGQTTCKVIGIIGSDELIPNEAAEATEEDAAAAA